MRIIGDAVAKMDNIEPSLASIIIRSKNEEKWIGYCLEAVFNQGGNHKFEVILVDHSSADHTVEVAKRFPIDALVNLREYRPGYALNEGIRASRGQFIVCLSAHCVPETDDWLTQLLCNFDDESSIAGVYGRQIPLDYSDPIDKRDLITVFGLDRRIQIKDYFFHNANSMLRRDVWEHIPFDEQVTNIEDRVWGKAVIEAGYRIAYEPKAAVYHHHGLHQGNAPERVRGTISIIDHVEKEKLNKLPHSLHPQNANIVAVVPIAGDIQIQETSIEERLLCHTIDALKQAKYLNSIYMVANDSQLASKLAVKLIDRTEILGVESMSLNVLMSNVLNVIERAKDYPKALLYVNFDYAFRPEGIVDDLICDAQYKGYDTVFPGLVDYGHYWFKDSDSKYRQTDASLKSRAQREPLYRALYGLGCLTSSWVVRSGRMVGGRTGILAIEDQRSALRLRNLGPEVLSETFLRDH
jgi:glycosyltransferase involved in cell wall biosynthesis|tara:strand:- start:5820 stop:7220 length:1401 start_codon:yes stop_codon:yes gene_type:complete